MGRTKSDNSRFCESRWKASYTVEAAILMAIILTVMAALLFAAFYLHDRAVLQAGSCEIAVTGSNTVTTKEQQNVISELKKLITKDRLLGSRNITNQIDAEDTAVKVVWQGSFPIPGFTANYFWQGKLDIDVSWNSKKAQPANTIRKIRGVRKLINGGSN